MHEKLGHAHLARMHFSWAMDLDPKGANNQLKEAIEPAISRGPTDDDKTGQSNGPRPLPTTEQVRHHPVPYRR